MTQWSLEETYKLVRSRYGTEQLDLIRPCLQSVSERQYYAGYHYHEAKRIQAVFVAARLTDSSLLEVVFAQDPDVTTDFNRFLLEAGAHVVACVQSMHATADILAHAVYFGLGINRSSRPIEEWCVSIKTVVDRLRNEAAMQAVFALLDELNAGGEFAHLSALANHSKHRSIVRPSLNEDWTGVAPERHTLKIPAFTRATKHYPEVSAKEFLEAEYNRCSRLVVETGRALNGYLRA